MHLALMFGSLSVLGSLWGGVPDSSVCRQSSVTLSSVVRNNIVREAACFPQRTTRAKVTAFVNVTVVPMDAERVLSDQTVLVEGGRITALGPSDKVKVPADAVRIDGRGKYLIPGLADMHGHLSVGDEWDERQLLQNVAEGVTTVRTLDHPDAVVPVGQRFLKLKARAEAGDIVSPRMFVAAGWYTVVEKEIQSNDRRYPAPAEAARFVAAYQAAGYDFIKPYFEPLPVFDSMLTAARRLGLPVGGHIPNGVPLERALAGGMRSIEHLTGYYRYLLADTTGSTQRLPLLEARKKIPAIAAATKRAGVWNTPTLAISEALGRGADGAMDIETARLLAKGLQDSGASLLLGTDRGSRIDCCAPILVQDELEAMVRAGLTPYQALVTGTRNVAEYFSKLDSMGTVAVGKRADLVLLRGNPLQDIRYVREPAGVMLNGRWLGRADLDQLMLASSNAWIRSMDPQWHGLARPSVSSEQAAPLREHMKTFSGLIDSLTQATSAASDQVRQRAAAELGAMRALLTPAGQVVFDPHVRVWVREQARLGHPVTVPGLAAAP